jgi:hypothetical protein
MTDDWPDPQWPDNPRMALAQKLLGVMLHSKHQPNSGELAVELADFVRSQLPGSHQVVVDREALALYLRCSQAKGVAWGVGQARQDLLAALSPEPDIKETA